MCDTLGMLWSASQHARDLQVMAPCLCYAGIVAILQTTIEHVGDIDEFSYCGLPWFVKGYPYEVHTQNSGTRLSQLVAPSQLLP